MRVYLDMSAEDDCPRCKGLGVVEHVTTHYGLRGPMIGGPPAPTTRDKRFCECVESHKTGRVRCIPLDECEARVVYRVEARNFKFAVFDGKEHFIGIRHKFGNSFLDTENHWSAENFATCRPLEKTAHRVPDYIPVRDESGAGSWMSKELFQFLEQFE